MTSATAAMLGSAPFQGRHESAPSCRQDQPEHRTRKLRRTGPPSPIALARIAPASLVTTWWLHISRNCAANSRERERGNAVLARRRRERAKPSIGLCHKLIMWTGGCLGELWEALKLELDQRERRTVGHCLLARRSRLIETIGDTTRTAASRRIGSRELELVESVLRKLRVFDHTHQQPRIDADCTTER